MKAFLMIFLIFVSFFILHGMEISYSPNTFMQLLTQESKDEDKILQEFCNNNDLAQLGALDPQQNIPSFSYKESYNTQLNKKFIIHKPFVPRDEVTLEISTQDASQPQTIKSLPLTIIHEPLRTFVKPKGLFRKVLNTSFGKNLNTMIFCCYFHDCPQKDVFFALQEHMYKSHIKQVGKKKYCCKENNCNQRGNKPDLIVRKHSTVNFSCNECQRFISKGNIYRLYAHYFEVHIIKEVQCPLGCEEKMACSLLHKHATKVHPDIEKIKQNSMIKKYISNLKLEDNFDIPATAFQII